MTQRRIYQNEYPYFITWRTRENYPLFEKTKFAELLSYIIFNAGRLKRFNVLAYQIMPDHVHLLTMNACVFENLIAGTETRDVRSGKMPPCPFPTRVSRPAVGGNPYTISDLMYTIKSFYYKQIRVKYGIKYSCLQPRFYTRIADTEKYLNTVIQYIKQNPIKAELSSKYHRLPYQHFDWKKINNLF
ncbi:transposase [Patescibacteria group bacterium]|nr:transposase [Patescibacteria group bacterium]